MSTTIPTGVVEVRGEICRRCPAPCEHQHAAAYHANPCAACPVNHWRQYGRCERFTAPRGLGDLVAAVAQPIARAIDAAAGTKIAECGGCKKRREALNRIRL